MKWQKFTLVFLAFAVAGEAHSSWLERLGFSNLDGEGRGFWDNHARVRSFMTGLKDHVPAYVDWTQIIGEEPPIKPRVILQDPTNMSETLGAFARASIAREMGGNVETYGFYQREADAHTRTRIFDKGDPYATMLFSRESHVLLNKALGLPDVNPATVALLQTTSFTFTEKMLVNILDMPCASVGLVGVPLSQTGVQDVRYRLQMKSLGAERADTPERVVIRGRRGAGGIETAQTLDTLLEALGGTRVRSLVLEGAVFQEEGLGLLAPWLAENKVTSLGLGANKFHEKSLLELVPSFGKLTHLRLHAANPMEPDFFTTFGAMLKEDPAHERVMSLSMNGCTFEMKPRSHMAPAISLVSRLLTRGRMG